jgi:hypothetical protein
MDFVKWLETQWHAVAAAPVPYIALAVIVWVAAVKLTRMRLGDEAAAAKERAELYKQKIADLERDKTQLLTQLGEHGEDIAKIKADLDARPRIYVQPEEPADARDGDIWLK